MMSGVVLPDHRLVGRDLDDVERVDLAELVFLGLGRARHAAEFGIQPEQVLEGDRRQRLVLVLDLDAFFGLDRLVQTVRPAPPEHQAAGVLVNDDDFFLAFLVLLHQVVNVPLVDGMGAQGGAGVLHHGQVFGVGQVLDAQGQFDAPLAVLGERRRLLLFLDLVVALFFELADDPVHLDVQIGRRLGLAGDDQRRPGLVNQDGVHFVHDGEGQFRLGQFLPRHGQVVAQVVEAVLVVGAVGDVAVIGRAPDLARAGRSRSAGPGAGTPGRRCRCRPMSPVSGLWPWMMPTDRPRKWYSGPIATAPTLLR